MHIAECTIDIAAPVAVVWDVVTDLDRYGEWNPFVVSVPVEWQALITTSSARSGSAAMSSAVNNPGLPSRRNDSASRGRPLSFAGIAVCVAM